MLPNFYFIIAKIQAFVNEKSPTGRNFPKKEKMSGAWEHTPELVFLFLYTDTGVYSEQASIRSHQRIYIHFLYLAGKTQ